MKRMPGEDYIFDPEKENSILKQIYIVTYFKNQQCLVYL
jgi:hypothetical protein